MLCSFCSDDSACLCRCMRATRISHAISTISRSPIERRKQLGPHPLTLAALRNSSRENSLCCSAPLAANMRCIAAAAVVVQPPAGRTQRQRGASRRRQALRVAAAAASSSSSSSSSASSSSDSVLRSSIRLAEMRAAEQLREQPLFADSYSAALVDAAALAAAAAAADASTEAAAHADAAAGVGADAVAGPSLQLEALATRFLDEQLLKAVTTVNLERDLAQVGAPP